jgi:4-hydroxy-tetrahydrodipicolinate synthase
MTTNPFSGLGTALVTPFKHDGSLDLEAVKRLVKRQLDGGVDMLIPCGTTGEAVTLSNDEYEQVVGTVVDEARGKALIIAGAGSNSTARSIENAAIAKQCGADAVLVVGPYYNKPTQEGFYRHFTTIADAVQIPMVIYNVPGRTGSNISADTQIRLSHVDSIVATKEASANFSQIMRILNEAADGFKVLSGDDNLALPQILIGAHGVISVISNEAPADMARMVHAAADGDLETARGLHYKYLELMETNFIESSPGPVKAAMAMMGLIEEAYRLPMVPIQEQSRSTLRSVLQKLEMVERN